jgi:hypothetical protein
MFDTSKLAVGLSNRPVVGYDLLLNSKISDQIVKARHGYIIAACLGRTHLSAAGQFLYALVTQPQSRGGSDPRISGIHT